MRPSGLRDQACKQVFYPRMPGIKTAEVLLSMQRRRTEEIRRCDSEKENQS